MIRNGLSNMNKMDAFATGSDNDYLDITKLAEGCRDTKLAYVNDTKAGMTKMQTGFFTFFVKDCGANMIRAQLFNVSDFASKGLTVKYFENKPVKITFIPQMYNGQWSLIVEEITLWDGEFDYRLFRGTVDVDYDGLQKLAQQIMGTDWIVYKEYSTTSLANVCAGHCGGFLKLLSMCAYELLQYNKLPDVNTRQILEVYFYVMDYYYRLLVKQNNFVLVDQTEIFDLLRELDNKVQGNSLSPVISDTCRTLLIDGMKPQHIISHLISSTVKNAMHNLNLIYVNSTLTPGTLTSVGGDELLLKY